MLIALGVTGGIAAYKACEIVRGLDKAGVEVQVVLTGQGARFVTPLTLQTLSRRQVMSETVDLDDDETIRHIELTRRVDALLVAPATANALAKFAAGVADDLLSTLYTAVTAPVLVAPAMNTRMLLHPATQRSLARLRADGVEVIDPDSGWLAEGELGWGRMAEPERIVEATLAALRRGDSLAGRRIVVSAGPTREPLDPVRYLSNRSSGKMGFALAAAAARRGAEVVLVSGPVSLPTPYGVRRIDVVTGEEMRRAVLDARDGAEAVFMAAAVVDFATAPAAQKIKKDCGGGIALALEPTADILAELGRDRRERVLVGFAAETERLHEHARAKLERKSLDFIVANDVSRPDLGFDSERNAVSVLGRDGSAHELPAASKREIAEGILDRVFPVERPA